MRIALISFFDARRYEEYPVKHALSSMRLGAYLAKLHPQWTVRLRAFDIREEIPTIATALLNEKFDVVGLPAYIWTRAISLQVAHLLAASETCPLIVVGGPETRAMDYSTWPEASIFVMGQGEEALLWLCRQRDVNSHFTGASLPSDVAYPVYSSHLRREGTLCLAKPSKDMLRLPHGLPLFSDEFNQLLQGDEVESNFVWFESARGCIYSCSFCGHNTLPFFATFDLDFVRQEVELLRKKGITRIFLIDPIMGGRAVRGKELLRIFSTIAPEISISAYMRPEFLDEEFIELLVNSNINELLMGLQTTNPNVPKHVRGNNFAKIMRYVPTLAQLGVRWRAELIVGLPGDTLSGLQESLRFTIDELHPWSVHAYHLTAIPETRLFELLDKTGEPYWIQADERLRVTSANSFTNSELSEMLIYAGAVTSLHSFLRDNSVHFEYIHSLVQRLLATSSDQETSIFRFLDMSVGIKFWQKLHESFLTNLAS